MLNGEKIFCTNGKLALEESNGVVVVWATVDRSAGRAGMKPFVVEAGTPGVTVEKVEIKHGIRASDTASIVFRNARIPYDNILGSAEVVRPADKRSTQGFKGAMATFDASRPLIAASAIGVGRAALEFVKKKLAEDHHPVRQALPRTGAVQADVLEMEMQLKAAGCHCARRACHHGERNSLESMAKAKRAGGDVGHAEGSRAGGRSAIATSGWSRSGCATPGSATSTRAQGGSTLDRGARILGYSSKELT